MSTGWYLEKLPHRFAMIKLPPIALLENMHFMLAEKEFICIPEVIFRNFLLAKIMWKIHGALRTWRSDFFSCNSQHKSDSACYVLLHRKVSRRFLAIYSNLLFVADHRFLSSLPWSLVAV